MPEVDSVGLDCEGHVTEVVHDERHAFFCGDGTQFCCDSIDLILGVMFLTILKQAAASSERASGDLGKRPFSCNVAIENEIETLEVLEFG